jgi:hypothetical protein
VETVGAGQHDLAAVVGSEADGALSGRRLPTAPHLHLLGHVDHEQRGEYLGEHFFEEVLPAEEGVGDSDEYEIEGSEVEDELVEE